MRAMLALSIVPMLSLGGCEISTKNEAAGNAAGATVSVDTGSGEAAVKLKAGAGGVAVDLPGFSANVKTPGLNLDAAKMDIDGMKLSPGAAVTAIDVVGRDAAAGGDRVRIGFTSPDAPAAVLAHYRAAGPGAGYAMRDAGGGVEGEKPGGKRIAISAKPAAAGSTGEIIVTDPS